MATKRIEIGELLVPNASGSVYWQPASVLGTNDLYPTTQVLAFPETGTKIGAMCKFPVPKDYVGSPKIVIRWRTTVTANNAVFDVDYRAVAVAESSDQATHQESLTVTDAAGAAALDQNDCEVSLTAANLAVDDTIWMIISRDMADAADTLAAATVEILQAWLEYVDA